MSETKLWAILIPGPDDLFACASEAQAQAAAEAHNKAMAATDWAEWLGLTKEQIEARVIEWPHSAESHAEALTSGMPDVMDTTNSGGIPDSLFNALHGTDA